MKIQHLILTRFNCRFAASWTRLALDPIWLEGRFHLFETYCLPSVLAQDCRNFKWIIFFDENTPDAFKARISNIQDPRVESLYVGWLSGDLVRLTIRDRIPPDATHVITSRLDNDDAIAPNYIRRLQDNVYETDKCVYLNIPDGYILYGDKLYRRRDYHNAFVSLVEAVQSSGDLQGVWTVQHTEINRHAPVRQVGGEPGWLQVIHDANISNKVRGWRATRKDAEVEFPFSCCQLDNLDFESGVWCDRYIKYPIWSLRDGLAELYRGVRAFGK